MIHSGRKHCIEKNPSRELQRCTIGTKQAGINRTSKRTTSIGRGAAAQRERQALPAAGKLALNNESAASDWTARVAWHYCSSLPDTVRHDKFPSIPTSQKTWEKGRSTSVQIKSSISDCQLFFCSLAPLLSGFRCHPSGGANRNSRNCQPHFAIYTSVAPDFVKKNTIGGCHLPAAFGE